MKFIKKENNVIVEAPYSKVLDNGTTVINYNHPSNEANLLAAGYLKYTGSHPLNFLDIVNGEIVELQYPPVNEIRKRLINRLYELKCSVAYNGIILQNNEHEYTFETNPTSITLINSTLVAATDDNIELNWKVYENNKTTFYTLKIAQLKELFAFGMNVINSAFNLESELLTEVRAMPDEQLADSNYIAEFESRIRTQFESINKTFAVNN